MCSTFIDFFTLFMNEIYSVINLQSKNHLWRLLLLHYHLILVGMMSAIKSISKTVHQLPLHYLF